MEERNGSTDFLCVSSPSAGCAMRDARCAMIPALQCIMACGREENESYVRRDVNNTGWPKPKPSTRVRRKPQNTYRCEVVKGGQQEKEK